MRGLQPRDSGLEAALLGLPEGVIFEIGPERRWDLGMQSVSTSKMEIMVVLLSWDCY